MPMTDHTAGADECGWAIDRELNRVPNPVSRRELAEMLRQVLIESPFVTESSTQAWSVVVRFDAEDEAERRALLNERGQA
ncbi:MAG TPA: hypothetical protein VMN79_02910 [Casimicrobiaceae bacterium]|nr:hypothetical protein [Casimicrobiaceae bacterium]